MDKAKILAAEDLKSIVVPVPEWGGDVRVWTMTGEQRERFEDELDKYRNEKGKLKEPIYRAALVAFTAGDEGGVRTFAPSDIPALAKKSARVLILLVKVAEKLNGMTEKEIAMLEKNFDGGDDEGTPSASSSS